MGRAKKATHKFGLASGRHRNSRKQAHLTAGRGKPAYQCLTDKRDVPHETNGKTVVRIVRKIIHKKYKTLLRPIQQSKYHTKYNVYRPTSSGVSKDKQVINKVWDGYGFVNLASLQTHVSDISLHAALCEEARKVALTGGSPIRIVSELSTFGLASVLKAECCGCKQSFSFNTSPKLNNDKSSQHFDINVRAVWGSIVTGNGRSHLNEFLACCDSPGVGQHAFSRIENDLNKWWQEVLIKNIESAIEEEKAIAISKGKLYQGVPAISVVCDGGWSKRTHKHTYNANGGVAIIIGVETKKVLHIGIRNKYCYICSRARTLRCTPRDHQCFKNWDKSSQAMESDIIVEGFLKADSYGIRYINIIGDGDSSVFARIREEVPVWGKFVQKIECANHVCKCVRSNLEQLVVDNPSYKGKGNLCKRTRIRLVSSIRCAIRMRSNVKDKKEAAKMLTHDIHNSIHHIYGQHDRCSADFCKAKKSSNQQMQPCNDLDGDVEKEEDFLGDQSKFWSDGTSVAAQEESRGECESMKPLTSAIIKDVSRLLQRVASKSDRPLGNNTTNLAECWMHLRSKFDGGKIFNICNRGSWHTRCYAGALRFNLGPTWSPQVWEVSTDTKAGSFFTSLYEQRETCLNTCNLSKKKPESLKRRWELRLKESKNGVW